MHKRLRRVAVLIAVLLLLCALGGAAAATQAASPLTILFTHDTHDHWVPTSQEDGSGTYGGYTRLATLLREQREGAQGPVVTLDGGDFSMGSLIQTIYSSDAPELRALGAMGYDAVTLGNHEFDYQAAGLSEMLRAAKASGEPLPAIVEANYKPPEHDTVSLDAWREYGISDYTIIERDGLRVGVFGLMGVDADECAPLSGMEFEPIAAAARRVVAELEDKADYIICLSHSGTEKGKGEDYELAKEVNGIDVIISGHTHSTTQEPIQVNDTLIVSGGPYTEHLGHITIGRSEDGKVQLEEFQLLPLDDTVPGDKDMTSMAKNFQKKVEEEYLRDYGLSYDQILATNPTAFTPIRDLEGAQREEPLGNLIADAYIHAVKEAEGTEYVPVDFAVVASGVIRASFAQGDISTADAFQVSSLGVGADGTPGYPLISVWLYGRELKAAFEVDASVSPIMSAAQLYGSGMEWSFNPHRLIFNKVTDCAQIKEDGTRLPIEDDRLYRVVTGLYSGQMLGTVNSKSYGILAITPRDSGGEPVTNWAAHIIHNQKGAEVKEWYALAAYLQSMGTVDERYSGAEGRKNVQPSWSPVQLLKLPNRVALLFYAVVLVLLAAVITVVFRLKNRRKHRAYGPRRGGSGRRRRYRG